ncbi:ATP phosphoribosyltransferase [Pseudogracilibacillus sp. ICA-222130]|uniref:ATP phosphoribosyltransferase n=1 Tax=Pseudogracilibacillus sp. ICA-222130 TaxID=3134655 RepID=UPI0030BB1F88
MEQITLAIGKGRTAKDAIKLLEKANITFPDFNGDSRKLIFYSADKTIKMLYVKSVDVTTYVEQGAAHIGIVGRDNILEQEADLYEFLDLKIGQCRFSVASLHDIPLQKGKTIKVATKYPNIAKQFFAKKGMTIEAIKLNGSVELAPLIGMSDCIVDIVETGSTIRENGLTIIEDIEHISTRVVVNKASFATKTDEIQRFIEKLKVVVE